MRFEKLSISPEMTVPSIVWSMRHQPLGLYRGISATLVRDAIEGVGYFFTIECTTRSDRLKGIFGASTPSIAGAMTGVVHSTLGFPFDCIKTSMQTRPDVGYREIIAQLYANGGIRRFYRGCPPAVFRAIVAHASAVTVMDRVKLFL